MRNPDDHLGWVATLSATRPDMGDVHQKWGVVQVLNLDIVVVIIVIQIIVSPMLMMIRWSQKYLFCGSTLQQSEETDESKFRTKKKTTTSQQQRKGHSGSKSSWFRPTCLTFCLLVYLINLGEYHTHKGPKNETWIVLVMVSNLKDFIFTNLTNWWHTTILLYFSPWQVWKRPSAPTCVNYLWMKSFCAGRC